MRTKRGFTLVEVSVVIGLALVLVGVLVSLYGRSGQDTRRGAERLGGVRARLVQRRLAERQVAGSRDRSRLSEVYRPVLAAPARGERS